MFSTTLKQRSSKRKLSFQVPSHKCLLSVGRVEHTLKTGLGAWFQRDTRPSKNAEQPRKQARTSNSEVWPEKGSAEPFFGSARERAQLQPGVMVHTALQASSVGAMSRA